MAPLTCEKSKRKVRRSMFDDGDVGGSEAFLIGSS